MRCLVKTKEAVRTVLLLAWTFPLSGALLAQQQLAPPSCRTPDQPGATTATTREPAAAVTATRAGRIRKKDGRYVLRESASKEDYKLDNQKIAKRYAGRVVFITGTVDEGSKTIQVKQIEVAA